MKFSLYNAITKQVREMRRGREVENEVSRANAICLFRFLCLTAQKLFVCNWKCYTSTLSSDARCYALNSCVLVPKSGGSFSLVIISPFAYVFQAICILCYFWRNLLSLIIYSIRGMRFLWLKVVILWVFFKNWFFW